MITYVVKKMWISTYYESINRPTGEHKLDHKIKIVSHGLSVLRVAEKNDII